jgi:NAD+ synthase (glutamine-hydrolysing)
MLRLALAQINPRVGDLKGNTQKILQYIAESVKSKVDVVAFPELSVTGYPPEDLLLKTHFVEANLEACKIIASYTQNITSVFGFVDSGESRYNAAAVAHQGKIIGTYRKIHLPNYGVFDEKRYFGSGKDCPVFVVGGAKIGINICEDIWFKDGPTRFQKAAGADLILNINGSPFSIGKKNQREQILRQRIKENNIPIAYVNMVGGQDELVFDGSSMVAGSDGKIIARGNQFAEDLIICDLDIKTDGKNSTKPSPAPSKYGTPEIFVSYPNDQNRQKLVSKINPQLSKIGEVYEALVLGTRDYVKKCGFDKVLIALSGGIDSSLVAAIATDALGPKNVVGISMPSKFSSIGSKTDAQRLANNLGIQIETIPIEQSFDTMEQTLKPQFEGTEWNTAEENMQSRIRGNLIMSMSNKFGWMVLTTGNKSEMAVGYATIYGDMAGGFAVIKDVPKMMVYELCNHLNSTNRKALIPQSVIKKPPSAELRDNQKDSDSLPDYNILDPILEAYVENNLSYDEIVSLGYKREVIQHIVGLVDRNEYKRRQSAPGIKITDMNFGRDRRMPVANGYNPFK